MQRLYSKIEILKKQKYHWIDCQVYTSHMKSLGAKLVSQDHNLIPTTEYKKKNYFFILLIRKNWSVYAESKFDLS